MLDVLSSLENNALLCGVAVCSFQKLCSAQYGDQGIRDTRYPSTDTLEFQCICTALGYNFLRHCVISNLQKRLTPV